MASTTKKSVSASKKQSKANTTFNTLTYLPKSIREGDKLFPKQKELLNYFLGLLNSWSNDGVSFFVSYEQIKKETGISSSNTIDTARKKFRALGFMDFDSHNISGKASDYRFDIDVLNKWREERKQEMLAASTMSAKALKEVSNEIETRSQSTPLSKVSMKEDKQMKTNDLKVSMENYEQGLNGGLNDNQFDDNDMTKFEMMQKIFAALEEINAKIDTLIASNAREHKELTDSIAVIQQGLNGGLNGSFQGLNQGLNGGLNQKPHCDPSTVSVTYTDTEKEIYKEKEGKEGKEPELRTRTHATPAHAREDKPSNGVEVRNGDKSKAGMPSPSLPPIDEFRVRFGQIITQTNAIADRWSRYHDSERSLNELNELSKELNTIAPHLPKDEVKPFSDFLQGFKSNVESSLGMSRPSIPPHSSNETRETANLGTSTPQMANPITQTTKVQGNGSQTARMSKRELNDEVTKHFNAIKKARAEWSEDHDNVKADNAIGKALDEMQRLLPLGISEKQYTTVWNMARDYYTKARGLSDVPPVGSLLGAHYDEQLAKATEPLSEPFLTPEQIQTMKNLTEEIKDRDIEYFDDDFDVDNAVKTLKAIAASISYAHSSLVKGAKVEARSQIEKAKESLRAIMHQPANWSFWAPQINENLISATMAIELSLTGDTTPLSSLIELALSNDSQVLKDMVYTLLNKHIRLLGAPQNKRDEVALLKMKFEEARNSRPQPQPQEPTPAKEEQPISVPSTSQPQDEEDDDELPF